ncbi:cytochrome P450 [Phanerochaete sordida]|uniref:Cytochrome P450 n=1 Tax=Phanerochaete sordida TaxID=48140 RepID=A0A9P3GKR6_9APHY|nr:cytochrome P450 [Phanerochaete sordida]
MSSGAHNFGTVALLSTLAALAYALLHAFRRLRLALVGKSLPPGPLGVPLLGALPFMVARPEVALNQWAQKYGPLYSVWLGEQLHVVVSDLGIAKGLFETQNMVFSSRKETFLKSGIVFAGRGISAASFGESWCRNHRLVAKYLNSDAVPDYLAGLEVETAEMLKALYIKSQGGTLPLDPHPHFARTSLNNLLTVLFGLRTDTVDHPLVAHWLKLTQEYTRITAPLSNAVDFVPGLRRFPAWTGIGRARRLHQSVVGTCSALVSDVDRRMKAEEDVPDCLARHLLKAKEEESLDDLDVVVLCAELMLAAVEKTAAVVSSLVAEIAGNADVQARGQAELDRVVGRDRLPGSEHEKDLPYISAIVKETERLHNPLPLGVPHMNTEDATYRGHFIPKNSVIILNTTAMTHDASLYGEPNKFDPERHLKGTAKSTDQGYPIFGIGPRACLGKPLAQHEIQLAAAGILWAFEIERVDTSADATAQEDAPAPLRVKLTPRHNRVSAVLGYAKAA